MIAPDYLTKCLLENSNLLLYVRYMLIIYLIILILLVLLGHTYLKNRNTLLMTILVNICERNIKKVFIALPINPPLKNLKSHVYIVYWH